MLARVEVTPELYLERNEAPVLRIEAKRKKREG